MTSTWLDTNRFPGRRHLAAVARQHTPLDRAAGSFVAGDLSHEVERLWAARLGIERADLVLVGSDAEASRLVAQGLLTRGDVALLAEPMLHDVPGAVLATGAAYVDLGRLADGAIDLAALQAAQAAHPEAVMWLQQPGLTGAVDALPGTCRAVVLDARLQPGWDGRWRLPAGVTAALVTLRDPDEPQAPLLHGIVCAPGTGPDLQLVQGPPTWPQPLMQQALAVLQGLDAHPHWPDAAEAHMAHAYAAFVEALRCRPGVHVLPRAGVLAAAECLAGDAESVAASLTSRLAPVLAFGAHPLRSLVVLRLAAAHVAG